ncbi:MAG: peptide chain release factor N(5)-glutamine methyltransferase [Candidatus Promineifilaceae bacterium]|nr:peptide chain release factor N(5)-glutamine methyltransferase [Candidatus Promineifilaceae bacterium]
MNVLEALAFGRRRLTHLSSPALEARLLLQHVLRVEHTGLIAHSKRNLSAQEQARYMALLERAAAHEPIPYIIGHAPFFGREFVVRPSVLIPRPETELLLERALQWVSGRDLLGRQAPLKVVDVGTGSGCLAVSLTLALPQAQVTGVDVSADALAVAGQNAARHNVSGRIDWVRGSLLTPLDGRFDLIVANLPYVADEEWSSLPDSVKWYEPALALRGGPGGLALIRRLLTQASTRLAPRGAIMLEIGWQQGAAVRRLTRTFFPAADYQLSDDYAGRDRIMAIFTHDVPETIAS